MVDKARAKKKTSSTVIIRGYMGQVMPGSGLTYHLYSEGQAVSSEGHPYRLLGKVHNRDIGGPFLNRKFFVDHSWESEWTRNYVSGYEFNSYYGILSPHQELTTVTVPRIDGSLNKELKTSVQIVDHLDQRVSVPNPLASINMDAFGTSVISSLRPTNPVVDLAEFLGELASERKLFSVPGKAGSLSGEYLNYMFGVAPTISTYQDFRKAAENAEKLLEQYSRDSGRLVRRRYYPEPTLSTSVTMTAPQTAQMLGHTALPLAVSSQSPVRIDITKKISWGFAGAFIYHLPKEGLGRSLAELDRLYGVVPGIDTVWQLIPFSWLVDYFVNIGDILENVNTFASDGLIMPYAYVMREERTTREYTWTGSIKSPSGAWTPRTLTARTTTVLQQRRPANPFGFGIDVDGLTPRQLSIIAALGLSRS